MRERGHSLCTRSNPDSSSLSRDSTGNLQVTRVFLRLCVSEVKINNTRRRRRRDAGREDEEVNGEMKKSEANKAGIRQLRM